MSTGLPLCVVWFESCIVVSCAFDLPCFRRNPAHSLLRGQQTGARTDCRLRYPLNLFFYGNLDHAELRPQHLPNPLMELQDISTSWYPVTHHVHSTPNQQYYCALSFASP